MTDDQLPPTPAVDAISPSAADHPADPPADGRPDQPPDQVERRVVLPADVDDVWRALTDPEALAAWWGEGTELDARPGGRARFVEDGQPARVGLVAEVVPGRRLRIDWWPEDDADGREPARRVTIEIEPDGDGTAVHVTEADLADLVVHPPVIVLPPPPHRRGPRASAALAVLA